MRKFIFFIQFLLPAMFIPAALSAQKAITGTVIDPSGRGIPAATILINHSSQGTSTDNDGKFKLTVPPGAELTISSLGFLTKTIRVGNDVNDLTIRLEQDVARLDEIVVTGLSTSIKRRNLANAVATVSATELNGTAPAQTLDGALNGKVPGAYINANTGAPGGGTSVKLRGVTSVYGNTQPLYVVDGVFVDNTATSGGLNAVTNALANGSITSNQDNPSSRIADINAEDIENVEILKGASAAAIYGSKAAAGVVIITTKRGRPGRTRIVVSQDVGFIKARKLLGVRQFNAQRAASLSSDSLTGVHLASEFQSAQAAGKIYDYEKEVFGNTGFARNTLLSVSGGNERTGFYFSAGQKDESGIVRNTGYRNSSLRLNVDHRINDNIKLSLSSNFINSSADRGLTGNDNAGVSTGIALSSTPGFAELHADQFGNYPNNPFAASNPLQTIALMQNNESVNRFINGLAFDATLQKNDRSQTRLIARGGFDYYDLQTNALFPANLQFQAVNKGTSIQGSTSNLNMNALFSLVNTFTPSDKVSLTASAGLTQETGDYNNVLNAATQVIAGQSNINQAGALTATQFRSRFQNTGYFVQEEATLIDAIALTGGIRFDRSSNNGDAGKFYAYPKAGLSWNLTRSGIVNDAGFFDNLKVRAAYGQANNVPAYGSKFTSLVISNIAGLPGSLIDIQEGQPGIKPERQTEFETGVDFSFLKGAVSIEATYYDKNVYDFLMLSNVPSSSGFSTKWVNAGNLRNRGVEIGLNARPIANRLITWNTSVNFWLNRSLVTRLTIPPTPQGSFGYVLGTFQIEQGKSATQIIGLGGPGGSIAKWGDAEPKFQLNTYNEISFNNKLSLRFLIHVKAGGENVNLTNLENDFGGTSADYDKVTNKLNLPDAIYRITQIGVSAQEFVQNSGYVRLREAGLYYTFNRLPVHGITALKIGVSLNNFVTITKYKSYDPEVSNFGTGFSSGVDVDPYPATKRADLHLSLEF
ncbi:MAG: SusC/RagA family TonB-linked outer membrane protein [Bacteroidota bacterium]|nr:SusC/RagA family TonB-linked outer membrane protein [Bacteroidota bacterium]MDP4256919.1 SusC/RagA family TonB-linked outer membrane protein [Bacteroidota bacterium]